MRTLIFLLVPSVSFAGGFALSGIGSKGVSFGASYTALVNDWTAIYWNPANLHKAGKQFGVFANFVFTSGQATTRTGIIGMDGPYSLKTYPVRAVEQTFFIPSFGIVFPINQHTLAFGVYAPFGLGAKWDLYSMPIGYRVGRLDDYPEIDHESSISITNIMFAYSRAFSNLSVGLALGVAIGDIVLRQVNFGILDADQDNVPDLGYPYSLIPIDTRLKGKGTGFALNFGLQYDANKLSLGFALRYVSSLALNGSVELSAYKPYSPYYYAITGNDLFLGGIAYTKANASTTLPLPLIASLGASYRFSDKLNFALGFEYQMWNVFDTINVEIDGTDPIAGRPLQNEAFVENWNSTFKFSIGMEYLWRSIPLRFAFTYDQSPVPDETFSPLIPDPGDKFILSGGFGYSFGKISMDTHFEYFILPERNVDPATLSYVEGMPGSYRFGLFALGVSFNYGF